MAFVGYPKVYWLNSHKAQSGKENWTALAARKIMATEICIQPGKENGCSLTDRKIWPAKNNRPRH